MTSALSNKLHIGHRDTTVEEGDQGTLGKEIWNQKWGQKDSSTD